MARRYLVPRAPRSEVEARARTVRKLAAIEAASQRYVEEIAGYWDEGIVSHSLDQFLEDLKGHVATIKEAMDEEITRHKEEDSL